MQGECFYRVVVFGLLCVGCALCYDTVEHEIGGRYVMFTNEPPTDNVEELPRSPVDIPTAFYLYRRGSSKKRLAKIATRRSSTVDDDAITGSGYDANKRTIFICHGWLGSHRSQWVKDARKLILEQEDVNIIAVDYQKAAWTSWEQWKQSVADSFLVGRVMAYFMEELNRITGASYENMYIIGTSYGAQIACMAGKALKSSGFDLGRITGLDAAEENYTRFKGSRCEAGDALFVDTIHSDGYAYDRGIYGWGVHLPHGDVDFYPNGGVDMPGCDQTDLIDKTVCDHGMSVSYFLESISRTGCDFVSYPCPEAVDTDVGLDATCNDCGNGCTIMGYWADTNDPLPSGPYYVKTNANSPYCIL